VSLIESNAARNSGRQACGRPTHMLGLEERWLASEPIGLFGAPDEVAAAVV
jgi:hypothetical protein